MSLPEVYKLLNFHRSRPFLNDEIPVYLSNYHQTANKTITKTNLQISSQPFSSLISFRYLSSSFSLSLQYPIFTPPPPSVHEVDISCRSLLHIGYHGRIYKINVLLPEFIMARRQRTSVYFIHGIFLGLWSILRMSVISHFSPVLYCLAKLFMYYTSA